MIFSLYSSAFSFYIKSKNCWWLLKPLPVMVCFFCLAAIESTIFANTAALIGTPPRTEIEAKFALTQASHREALQLTKKMHEMVKDHLQSMDFGTVAGCALKIDKKPKSFAFLDHYLDTKEQLFYHNAASYRLRMRWSSYHNYLRHTLFPWSSLFPPTRVEIQAKTRYRLHSNTELASEETRLEFREESSPFNDGFPLPNFAHVPTKEALSWAISGEYKNHSIYPYHTLANYLNTHNLTPQTYPLNPQLTLLNQRHRFHLNCKHPLGTGPNPHQLFIITIDHTHCLDGCCAHKQLIEIEVERERNTSTYLDTLKSYENSPILKNHPIAQRAFDYTKKIRHAYISDHRKLKHLINSTIHKNSLKTLSIAPKYKRFACARKHHASFKSPSKSL